MEQLQATEPRSVITRLPNVAERRREVTAEEVHKLVMIKAVCIRSRDAVLRILHEPLDVCWRTGNRDSDKFVMQDDGQRRSNAAWAVR
ncbi:hypothetical protein RRF57_002155 [Xylaria bambusicola]|uniref:Uncharacterized protein n=1 Tax=Xylaria bambusicola TaxID=326684 RepID=A0AAN7U6I9_9PEZI